MIYSSRTLSFAKLLAVMLFSSAATLQAIPNVWINEIHYNNDGADTAELVELAGTAGADLDGWSLILYNGNDQKRYASVSLTGTITNQSNGFGTLSFFPSSFQNGDPDGLALTDKDDNLVQFISYGGAFIASGGPADGQLSEDIGVSENSTTPAGHSLQLAGKGNKYSDFTWSAPQSATSALTNANQSFTQPVTEVGASLTILFLGLLSLQAFRRFIK